MSKLTTKPLWLAMVLLIIFFVFVFGYAVGQKYQTKPVKYACANPMILGQDIADLSIHPGQTITSPVTLSGKITGGYLLVS